MAELLITPSEVHIWELRLTQYPDHKIELLESLLSEDELDRAGKLRFKEDRTRFIIARGHLRILLGEYLKKKPRQVWIRYGKHGKPYLNDTANPANLSFNLSHSLNTVVFALSKEREIGIDIEYVRPVSRAERIIERFFSEDEKAFYEDASSEEKMEKFFKLWCGREAYAKAIGRGIHLPGRKVQIRFTGGRTNNINDPEYKGSQTMSIHEITPGSGFVGSLAVSGDEPRITQRNIDELNLPNI